MHAWCVGFKEIVESKLCVLPLGVEFKELNWKATLNGAFLLLISELLFYSIVIFSPLKPFGNAAGVINKLTL